MNTELKRNGRLAQTRIYLCKLLRMFVYQSDWKVIPLGAVIAAVVTFVVERRVRARVRLHLERVLQLDSGRLPRAENDQA